MREPTQSVWKPGGSGALLRPAPEEEGGRGTGLPPAVASAAAVVQEEDVTRESRFNFSGYGMGHCLQVKDGTAVKATPANQLPQPPKDADAIKKKFVDRAKRIDTISRAAFPLAFLIFNIFYWITYKIIRHEDVHKKQMCPSDPRTSCLTLALVNTQ